MTDINASIVLYHNDIDQIKRVIESFFGSESALDLKLYLIDNSANDSLSILQDMDPRIVYIFNNKNLGYGAAHNKAIKISIKDKVPYHLVLNPDIYFDNEVVESLYNYMESNRDVGNIMPQVRYPDGNIQYLCKLLPTPSDLILRRFIPNRAWKEKNNQVYELRASGYDKIMNVPNLSGCFMFLRTSILNEIGLFDENIFMYLEDTDLNRRIHLKYKTIFYPKIEIYHNYAKESYVNKKLLKYHIESAMYYFNKWGWLFDKDRDQINKNTLKEIGL